MTYRLAEDTQIDVDANVVGTVTPSVDMYYARDVAFQVMAKSGSHHNHVVKLEVSMDDTNWFTTSKSITGVGITPTGFTNLARYARLKVTTPEGAPSTVDLTVQAK